MIIFGSYHKTGTALFHNIWKEYFKNQPNDYLFSEHFDRVPDDEIKSNKCVVIIRNPYEVIMSGTRYHQITSEKWVHVKNKNYGNMPYQEKINSLDDDGKILFEMNNCGKWNIDAMYNDIKNRNFHGNVLFIKLEELYERENIPVICEDIINHIKGENLNYKKLISCFENNLSRSFHRTNDKNEYTYPGYFKEMHYQEFIKLFPEDTLKILMYE